MALAFRHLDTGYRVDNLWDTPADGRKLELFDGMLLVTPPPIYVHEATVMNVAFHLNATCPPGARVFASRNGYRPTEARWFEPDVLVRHFAPADLMTRYLEAPALLVVEVASPSTRRVDRILKRAAYEEAGVLAYWMVEPSLDMPSITVLERGLESGELVEVATVEGDDVYRTSVPWELEVCPAALVR